MEWELSIRFKTSYFNLKAVLEYKSNQIIRIRVHGTKRTLLLETDMPLAKLAGSKKAIKWKLREGSFDTSDADTAALLANIINQLEKILAKEFQYGF